LVLNLAGPSDYQRVGKRADWTAWLTADSWDLLEFAWVASMAAPTVVALADMKEAR
jgi:hypothetical protein